MEIKNKKYYLSGINGIGMSAIAQMIKELGGIVEGSDINYKPITKILENKGIKVNLTQISENITRNIDYFVYSTAIPQDNGEFVRAKELKIPMIKRGEMLSYIFNTFKKSIAVAGTHGKTTTSSMFAVSLKNEDPYFAVGGIIPEYENNMRLGKSDFFVAEADESDNSFLYLKPKYSVITNIEMDHLEHHHSFDNILESFKQFIKNTEEMVVINYDCKNIRKYIEDNDKIKWYGVNPTEDIKEKLDIYASNVVFTENETIYSVFLDGKEYEFKLQIPGYHNVSNSLPVIYILYKNGVNINNIKNELYSFRGANRRFQILKNDDFLVIDDYGHHPTEIKTTIESIRNRYKDKKIHLIFEPHRYSRTYFFRTEFIHSLILADYIYLLPIYSASEINTFNISSKDLEKDILMMSKKCQYIEDNLYEILDENVKKGDIVLFMGAGSITKNANEYANR